MPSGKPEEKRAIIHVDMDAFYASVEVMDDPSLAGKPVIVGGTPEGRGVVSAASYEARRYGVHSAMSAARAHKLCPHGVFLTPRMRRYADLSRQIRAIFEDYTPLVEPISLDEAFLDVTASRELFGSAVEIGKTIKRRIREEVGLVASVGIAPNKFLAKLASDLEKPDGFVVIRQEEAAERLAPLPVGRLWGVGRVAQEALERLGVRTIGDLTREPLDALEARFGAHARRLRALALGIDDRPVVAHGEAKSVSAETTFSEDISNGEELRRVLDDLSERVAKRMRKSGLRGHTVQIKARFPDFQTVTRARTLGDATAETTVIRDTARDLLERNLSRRGRPLRLLGVGVTNLVGEQAIPLTLFEDDRSRRNQALDRVVDSLQDRFGREAIHRGRLRDGEDGWPPGE